MSGQDQSLLERIELPSIPREAATKMARVQEEFERADLEQCEYYARFTISVLPACSVELALASFTHDLSLHLAGI